MGPTACVSGTQAGKRNRDSDVCSVSGADSDRGQACR